MRENSFIVKFNKEQYYETVSTREASQIKLCPVDGWSLSTAAGHQSTE